jgi:hypothetical protein
MMIDRQEVLYAVRSVQRTPLLTFLVVLALSIGIGLNAGVFTDRFPRLRLSFSKRLMPSALLKNFVECRRKISSQIIGVVEDSRRQGGLVRSWLLPRIRLFDQRASIEEQPRYDSLPHGHG